MERKDVPLESFDLQFNTDGLKNSQEVRKSLVTIVRFLHKDIFPQVYSFFDQLPVLHDIQEKQIKTIEDGRYLFSIKSRIKTFLDQVADHIVKYLAVALRGVKDLDDSEYVEGLVLNELDSYTADIREIYDAITEKIGLLKGKENTGSSSDVDMEDENGEAIVKGKGASEMSKTDARTDEWLRGRH